MAIKASETITIIKERDINATWRFYRIASSTSTPSQPTEAQGEAYVNNQTVPSGWSISEPAYDGTSTNSLYTCDLTSFTDGGVSWSVVSKSSSYEAAKQAYNEALAAGAVAASKAKTFRTVEGTPAPPYSVGDIWVNTAYVYVTTLDSEVVSDKTYYTNNNGTYTVVVSPSAASLPDYYEKLITSTTYICITASESSFSDLHWVVASEENAVTQNNIDRQSDETSSRYDDLESYIEIVRNNYQEAIAGLEAIYVRQDKIGAYMQFLTYGIDMPLLVLGSTESQLQAHLQADALQFVEAGQVVAYLSGRALNVQERLSFGGFSFYKRSNNHFTLKNA